MYFNIKPVKDARQAYWAWNDYPSIFDYFSENLLNKGNDDYSND